MNENLKTIKSRVPEEWNKLIESIIQAIEENGYPERLKKTEVIRLLVHYRPSRIYLNLAIEEILKGFKGIKKINPEVEKWMKA